MEKEYDIITTKDSFRRYNLVMAKGMTRAHLTAVLWTLYEEFNNAPVKEVLNNTYRQKTFDRFIEIQYEVHECELYNLMKDNLVNKVSLDFEKEMIRQCLFSFEQEQYYSCACGTIPLLERHIAKDGSSTETNWDKLEKSFKQRNSKYFTLNEENNLEEHNIRVLMQSLTKVIDFDCTAPNQINRHWLLHGRAEQLPSKSDCLRLFNILELILEINDKSNE